MQLMSEHVQQVACLVFNFAAGSKFAHPTLPQILIVTFGQCLLLALVVLMFLVCPNVTLVDHVLVMPQLKGGLSTVAS